MKQITYYINGMHCASCELLIEKRVLDEHTVHSADASLSNKTLIMSYEKYAPSVGQLNDWFKEDGYTFSQKPEKQKKDPLVYFVQGKGIQFDTKQLKGKMKTALSVLMVFLVLYAVEKTGISRYVNVTDSSSYGLFFLFGLVAGLSSCAALIGGILLSLTKSWNERYEYNTSTMKKMEPHMYFHIGRLVGYGVLGALLGWLGSLFALQNVTLYALITIVVSLVMLLIGLQMAGVRWAQKLQIRLPKFVTRNVGADNREVKPHVPFSVGVGTVLLPCGFTLAAEGLALTSGNPWVGAAMMIFFVVGTMIPLLIIGLISVKGTSNPKRSRTFSFYAGVVLVIFALYNTNAQMNVLGYPSVSDVLAKSDTSGDVQKKNLRSPTLNKAGQQVLSVVAKGFEYTIAGSAQIQAGVPTKLVIDNQGILGCGRYVAARGLIDGFYSLKPGKNEIDIGKPKAGTYKITCSMGMVPPVTVYVQ